MVDSFRGDEDVDTFDKIGKKFESELNQQIDGMLADNSRWEAPIRKTRRWIYILLGFIGGMALAIACIGLALAIVTVCNL